MKKLKDLGSRLRPDGSGYLRYGLYECPQCKKTFEMANSRLKYKKHNVCRGCININRCTTHGGSKTTLYYRWNSIKERCNNPKNKSYKNYGGRGIKMYPAWENDYGAFKEYVSKLPHYLEDGYSLDRINNDGDYEPNNLRWATARDQALNKRKRTDYNRDKNGRFIKKVP